MLFQIKISWRFFSVWRRNALVWRKMAFTAILGNIADPLVYLFGLGYGLGTLLPNNLPQLGPSYMAFLAAGTVCASTMNAATFEALYSAFSRMEVQKSWEAILNAPVSLDDIVFAEMLWAASKSFLSGLAVIIVMFLLGLAKSWLIILAIPAIFLLGISFAALGLIFTAIAKDYGFFMYYFTLFITPMTMLSGVFFPTSQLPEKIQLIAQFMPLTHGVELIRPLLFGQFPTHPWLNIMVLTLTCIFSFIIALHLARKRLLS